MSIPRGLSAEEQAAWAKLAAKRDADGGAQRSPAWLHGSDQSACSTPLVTAPKKLSPSNPRRPKRMPVVARPSPAASSPGTTQLQFAAGFGHWNRKLKGGTKSRPITRSICMETRLMRLTRAIMSGLDQARAMQARVVLVIAGRERPARIRLIAARKRGAIRAKLLDWLAASHHADAISAIRRAHHSPWRRRCALPW